jgi:hypothetical protein
MERIVVSWHEGSSFLDLSTALYRENPEGGWCHLGNVVNFVMLSEGGQQIVPEGAQIQVGDEIIKADDCMVILIPDHIPNQCDYYVVSAWDNGLGVRFVRMMESSSPLLCEDMREIAYMGGFHGWNPLTDELEEED